MKSRLPQPRQHSKACAAFRRTDNAMVGKRRKCICGHQRWLWMYQAGDKLMLDIKGQKLIVVYGWDNFAEPRKWATREPVRGGCHVLITDSLGPELWLSPWTEIDEELELYAPREIAQGGEVDPLKGI